MSNIKISAWKVEVRFFDSEQAAKEFVKYYNLRHNTHDAAGCYHVAIYCGKARDVKPRK